MAAETYFRNLIEDSDDGWRDLLSQSLPGQIDRGLAVSTTASAIAHFRQSGRSLSSVDLIAGGPPCQGFSVAGRRIAADKRNSLPWEFLEVVRSLTPRAVLIDGNDNLIWPHRDDQNWPHPMVVISSLWQLPSWLD